MTQLVYVGTADQREFSAADLRALGVENANKLTLPRGVPVEVEDEAVAALFLEGPLDDEHVTEVTEDTDVEKLVAKTERAAQPDVPIVSTTQGLGTPGAGAVGGTGATSTAATRGARGAGRGRTGGA